MAERLPDGRQEQRFKEWKPPYDASEAKAEASRCLYCVDAPCVSACPTEIPIPEFIRKISTGNVRGAARSIMRANLLGSTCARVCPVEVLCAGDCVYNHWDRPPIQIGRLQRYATDAILYEEGMTKLLPTKKSPTGRRVACIGAGPASLTAAGLLALEGHEVVVFDKREVVGGLNTWGIAPYKMKAQVSLDEVEWIEGLGVEIRSSTEVGVEANGGGGVSVAALVEEYDAVFLGLGLGGDRRLGVPGEDGPGVDGATHLIERIKTDPDLQISEGERVVVVGGGNTAIDIAHELALLGAKDVVMVYRRGEAEMSGYRHEMAAARGDGVRLLGDRVPTAVVREAGRVVGLEVVEAADGRPASDGSSEQIRADRIVVAIGQNRATDLALAFSGVEVDSRGRVCGP